MQFHELFRLAERLLVISTLLLGVAIPLAGCDGSGSDTGSSSGGHAPSSLVGKTMKLDPWTESLTFSTSSEAKLNFEECTGTCAAVTTPSYSYNVTGSNSATFKASYSYTDKYLSIGIDNKTTGKFDLTLTFSSANYGTATGSWSWTFLNNKDNYTSDLTKVLSNSPFALVD